MKRFSTPIAIAIFALSYTPAQGGILTSSHSGEFSIFEEYVNKLKGDVGSQTWFNNLNGFFSAIEKTKKKMFPGMDGTNKNLVEQAKQTIRQNAALYSPNLGEAGKYSVGLELAHAYHTLEPKKSDYAKTREIKDALQSVLSHLYRTVQPKTSMPAYVHSWRDAKVYEKSVGNITVVVVQGNDKEGNMLAQDADAVVDAANEELEPGTGVSGFLYKAAGKPNIDTVWRSKKAVLSGETSKRLKVGEAWLNTDQQVGIISPDKKNFMRIIHAVAPRCGGKFSESDKKELTDAFYNAFNTFSINTMQMATWNTRRAEHGVAARDAHHTPTIVLPLLGAGAFGCAVDKVAECAVEAIKWLKNKKMVVVIAPFKKNAEQTVIKIFKKNWDKR